jgi:hypothetical protein
MEESRRPLDRIDPPHRAGIPRDPLLIVLLLLVTLGMRLWQIAHTEVLARDSIGYIRMAWQIENRGWQAAVTSPTAEQHPGYPLTVLAVHFLAGPWLGDDQPVAWQIAAQVASSAASLLLVLPVYLFARRLFNPAVAFASVLILQGLPAIGRLMGDGLSEAIFLVFAAFAFWTTLRAFDTGKPHWFLLCGLTSGLAYFVRPEGLLIALCTGLVLLVRQCMQASRQPWRPWLAQGAAVSLGALLCVGTFVGTTGKVTLKPTALRVKENLLEFLFGKDAPTAQVQHRKTGPLLAAWWDGPEEEGRSQRVGWAARQLIFMIGRGTFYVGWLFGFLGLWFSRARLTQPGVLVLFLVSILVGLLMFRVAWYLGYLSDRHLVLILLAFTPFIAAGLIETGRCLPHGGAWLAVLMVLGFAVPALYRTLLPLHDEREGFREAGVWLAHNSDPADEVVDPFAWTHYYAGRIFVARTQSPTVYIVHENSPNPHPHLRTLLANMAKERERGERVYSYKLRQGWIEVWKVARLPTPSA